MAPLLRRLFSTTNTYPRGRIMLERLLWKFAADNMHNIPDDVYVGFAFGSILAAVGMYVAGKRQDGLFLGVLTAALAGTMATMKILAIKQAST